MIVERRKREDDGGVFVCLKEDTSEDTPRTSLG